MLGNCDYIWQSLFRFYFDTFSVWEKKFHSCQFRKKLASGRFAWGSIERDKRINDLFQMFIEIDGSAIL